MKQKVCEREKGEERRVKVVIDGRPGLRPLLTVVRERASADACQPSLHPFLSSFLPPVLPLSIIVLFLLLLSGLSSIHSPLHSPFSPSNWHHDTRTYQQIFNPLKHHYVRMFTVCSRWF